MRRASFVRSTCSSREGAVVLHEVHEDSRPLNLTHVARTSPGIRRCQP
ncbi:hypothetical protein ACFPRL_07970 [Pseudoclavibacter helvolus]